MDQLFRTHPPKVSREVADTTLDKDLWMAENQSTGKGGGLSSWKWGAENHDL